MDYFQLPNKAINLSELLDLALGTPDPGSVNFSILYIILSYIIKHLKLNDAKPDVEKPSNEPQSQTDAKISLSDWAPNIFHNLQNKIVCYTSVMVL
ncbi:glutamine rich 2 [Schistosoma japonicum]|nr:glutamine rich 2 [Schistosoma japonicum]